LVQRSSASVPPKERKFFPRPTLEDIKGIEAKHMLSYNKLHMAKPTHTTTLPVPDEFQSKKKCIIDLRTIIII
jgi:hypothetical protein